MVDIRPLAEADLPEAARIIRLAFGAFLGAPQPETFWADRDYAYGRFGAEHTASFGAEESGALVGSNFATRWGSVGFFGPLTIRPDLWDSGIGQRLVGAVCETFAAWGVRHAGLFTFAESARHVWTYGKSGFYPRYLTAIMTCEPHDKIADGPVLLSAFAKEQRERTIHACETLTDKIDKGLDLTGEIQAALKQRTGDVVLTYTRGTLDGFAVCLNGPGSEGGEKTCYIKFGVARSGKGAAERFDKLLAACHAFASSRGATVEAGVNLAREQAYQRMRSHGYRVAMQGVAMQRPHEDGFNRADTYVIDDWR